MAKPQKHYVCQAFGSVANRWAGQCGDCAEWNTLFADDSVTPIDRATERWDEAVSPFRTVARLEIAAQDINQAGQAAYGESLAFSPWRTLRENRPIGSIADARRIAYPASATVRRSANGQSLQEPELPR